MTRSVFLSLVFHSVLIVITAIPCNCGKCVVCDIFGVSNQKNAKNPTRIVARDAFIDEKTLEKIKKKEEEKRVVSEQAPPTEKKKEKPDRIPLPDDLNKEKKKLVKKNKILRKLKNKLDRYQNSKKKNFLIPHK